MRILQAGHSQCKGPGARLAQRLQGVLEREVMRVVGRPGVGEPGALQPALHLGRCLEETGPREGSRLPSPEAQPGFPAPSGGLRNLRLAGTVPGVGRGGAAWPARSGQLPARPSYQPSWCPFADAAVGRPPAPASCSASLPESCCGQGPAQEAQSGEGLPRVLQGGGQEKLEGSHPSWVEPGSHSNNKVSSNCEQECPLSALFSAHLTSQLVQFSPPPWEEDLLPCFL